jgi:hypothetical protein
MISLRLAIPAILVATVVAACFTYFASPPPLVEADPLLPSTVPDSKNLPDARTATSTDQRRKAEEQASAFERAAEAILKRAPFAEASARTTGHVPLPKRRPIPR